jgi:UDP-glucose 4-epimerase
VSKNGVAASNNGVTASNGNSLSSSAKAKKARLRRVSAGSKEHVLITGGAGFIGSHLAEALLEDGHSVTAFDNLSTGRTNNIEHLGSERRFELCIGSINDQARLDALVAKSDVVFHLAAAVGVKLILSDPLESFRTNALGTEAVLRAAERFGTRVLIASTSEVYGKVHSLPQREDDDVLLGPTSSSRWSYAACKMLDEFVGLAHARSGLPVTCFRLFNTVGPRQTGTYGMVVPRFVEAAVTGGPLLVHGDGQQSRCFLHVQDAVNAILRLNQTPRAVGHVFNIGSTESVTITELAHRVLAAVGKQAGAAEMISYIPYEEAYPEGGFEDIPARLPDVSKIRQFTRWRAKLTLNDILRDVIATHEAVQTPAEIEEAIAIPAFA